MWHGDVRMTNRGRNARGEMTGWPPAFGADKDTIRAEMNHPGRDFSARGVFSASVVRSCSLQVAVEHVFEPLLASGNVRRHFALLEHVGFELFELCLSAFD